MDFCRVTLQLQIDLELISHDCRAKDELGPGRKMFSLFYTTLRECENCFTLKIHQTLFVHKLYNAEEFKTRKSPFCHFAGKSYHCRAVIVFEKLSFQNAICQDNKAGIFDRLVWMVGLTVEIKLRLQIPTAKR